MSRSANQYVRFDFDLGKNLDLKIWLLGSGCKDLLRTIYGPKKDLEIGARRFFDKAV